MPSRLALLLLLLLSITAASQAADATAWKTRSIYQLLTDRFWRSNGDTTTPCDLKKYCGGDWAGNIEKLQYIKDLGFDAIWISPVVDNTPDGYHGYWARDWEKVNAQFGDEAGLKRLVDAAHQMDMWVMVDVVANHVGPVEHDFSTISPFNKEEHYHKDCDVVDMDNQWQVEQCRLLRLPDLSQENPFVRQYLVDWIKRLVAKFGFDGIRIDTVPHIEKKFWTEFTQSAGVYSIGEVLNAKDSYIGDYQNYMDGMLNYGMWYTIRDVFSSRGSMKQISYRWKSIENNFKDVDLLGLFVDNHDNPRFLFGNGDWRAFKSALAFALTARGIPIFYYGSEQAYAGGVDPLNREPLWTNFNQNHEIYIMTRRINAARRAQQSNKQPFVERLVTDNLYVFTRGNFLVALTNDFKDLKQTVMNTGFAEGTLLCNIFYLTDCVKIENGGMVIALLNGEVKVFVPKSSSYFKNQAQSISDILAGRIREEMM